MRLLRHTALALISWMWVLTASAQEMREIRQLTTHPADDYDASVSADGRWMAFVSTRSGNADIWVKRLPQGRPVQLTTHQSLDTQPVWRPDGKALIFVSTRRDAKGDLWKLRFDAEKGRADGDAEQVTDHLGLDCDPAYSADGDWLYFTSDRQDGLGLWRKRYGRSAMLPVTGNRSLAALSPDGVWRYSVTADGRAVLEDSDGRHELILKVGGQTLFLDACWASEQKLIFSAIDSDSDGDGVVTPSDAPALWMTLVDSTGYYSPPVQISAGIHHDCHPAVLDSATLVFSSGPAGQRDLWTLPVAGLFAKAATARDQYTLALEKSGEWVTADGLEQAVLGFRRVADYFPDDALWTGKARLQIAQIYLSMGRQSEAEAVLRRLIEDPASDAAILADARLLQAGMDQRSAAERQALCDSLLTGDVDSELQAKAGLTRAGLMMEAGHVQEALIVLNQAAARIQARHTLWAQINIAQGQAWLRLGQREQALEHLWSVMERFGASAYWRDRVGQTLWQELPEALSDRIVAIQSLSDGRELSQHIRALIDMKTAEVLIAGSRPDQAQRELKYIAQSGEYPHWAELEATFRLARLYSETARDDEAIDLLKFLTQENDGLVFDPSALAARELLFELLIRSGQRLMGDRDYVLAMARLERALAIRPLDVDARRLWVEAGFRAGRIGRVLESLYSALSTHKDNAVLLYSLGLAHSYAGERDANRLALSNEYLKQALARDYRQVHPYRTLSYNYEAMERLAVEEANQSHGFFYRAGHAIMGPLRWLWSLLPWTEERKPPAYYELAIDALTTAIALNDEKIDPAMEAALAQNLANNFYNLGEFGYAKAFQYYETRLALDSTFASPLQEALIYDQAGRCGLYLEKKEAAARYLNRAMTLYTKLDRPRAAMQSRRRLAFLHHLAGDYETAIDAYYQLKLEDEAARRSDDVARDLRNIAFNYHLLGEPEDAMATALEALAIVDASPIPLKASPTSKLRIELLGWSIPVWGMEEIGGASSEGFSPADEAALLCGLISRNAEMLKDFDRAVRYETRRLEIARGRKDRLAERICLNRLGRLRFKQWHFDVAWEHFEEVFKLAEKKKDGQGQLTALVNLGETALALFHQHEDQKPVRSTLKYVQQAKARQLPVSDDWQQMRFEELAGRLYGALANEPGTSLTPAKALKFEWQRMGYLQQSREHLNLAFDLAVSLNDESRQLAIGTSLWETDGLLGDWNAAAERLVFLKSLNDRLGLVQYDWRLSLMEARLASARHESSASDLYRRSVAELQKSPIEPAEAEEALADRKLRHDLFVEYARLLHRSGDSETALSISEAGRQQWAHDLMLSHTPTWKRERHKILWGNLLYTRKRQARLARDVMVARKERAPYREVKTMETQMAQLAREEQELAADISREDDVLAFLAGVSTFKLSDVQKALEDGQGVLSMISDDAGTLVWAIDRNQTQCHEMTVNRQWWQEILTAFNGSDLQAREAAVHVDSLFRSRLMSWLDSRTSLVLVADGSLWQLPFAGLGQPGDEWSALMTLVYSGSLQEYALAYDRRKIPGQAVLAMGGVDDAWMAQLDDVTGFFGPGRATETAFMAMVNEAGRLYLGRWRKSPLSDPLSSRVPFFADREADGQVELKDFFQNDMAASLVLIPSARPYQGDDWESGLLFSRALLYADVPTMVTSLHWMASPQQRLWLNQFHQKMTQTTAAQALADAQLTLADSNVPLSRWAGLQVWGYGGIHPDGITQFARENLGLRVRRGRAYEREGGHEQALKQYDMAMNMARVLQDSTLIYRIFNEELRAAAGGELWARAAGLQKALVEWPGEEAGAAGQARMLNNLLAFYHRAGQYREAALVQEELLQDVGAPSFEEMDRVARLWGLARDWNRALTWAQRLCRLHERQGDEVAWGRALIRQGRLALEAERYWPAYEALKQGVGLLAAQSDHEFDFDRASGYQLWGLAAERLTRYSEARNHQQQGLAIFRQMGQPLQAAQGIQYLANLDWMEGRYRDAMLHQERALAVFDSLGLAKQTAMAYTTLGLIHHGLGDSNKARLLMIQALNLAHENGYVADEAAIRKNLGRLALQEGQFSEAGIHFNEAAQMDSLIGSQRGLAYDLRNLGQLAVEMKQPARALNQLNRALTLSKQVEDIRNEAQCYLALGRLPRPEATAALDSGLALIENLDLPEIEWRILRERARRHRDAGESASAKADYYAAIGIIENMRQSLGAESFKQGFLGNKLDVYKELTAFLDSMGLTAESVALVERAKSRNLIDMLGNSGMMLAGEGSTEARALTEAQNQVQEAQSRLAQWAGTADNILEPAEKALKAAWEDSLTQGRQRVLRLRNQLQLHAPEMASLVAVQPVDAQTMQRSLADSTVMLIYHADDSGLRIWALNREVVVTAGSKCTLNQLNETVQSFREQIGLRLNSDAEARQLWQWLVVPVAPMIKGAAHVVIVPFGPLHYCPFAALMDEAGLYWIERQSLSVTPSATVLDFCLKKGRPVSAWADSARVLALANPRTDWPDLPFADKEVAALQLTFVSADSLMGSSVTESSVAHIGNRYEILHFACHGEYTPDAPLFSALLLTADAESDGRLEAQEIFDLDLRCQLATLSACETGLSEVTRGDEVMGLARAFVFAGAPSLVTSLWKVDDLATAVMMKRFYRPLSRGVSRAQSLREAQLAVMHNFGRDPAFWAAFLLTGDYR